MTTTHSLATMIRTAVEAHDAAVLALNAAPDGNDRREDRAYRRAHAEMIRLRRLASLCRRACGLARAGDSVVLVAPAGTSPDEVAGGLSDEGSGEWRSRVEVLCPTAEEWPAAYAAARQRAGVEVVS